MLRIYSVPTIPVKRQQSSARQTISHRKVKHKVFDVFVAALVLVLFIARDELTTSRQRR